MRVPEIEQRRGEMSVSNGLSASTFKRAGFCFGSLTPLKDIYPGEEDFRTLANQYDYIPVYTEHVIADFNISVLYEKLNPPSPSCLLESLSGKENGRYAMLAFEALLEVQTPRGKSEDPNLLSAQIEGIKTPILPLPYFYGGFIGYWCYELALSYQNIKRQKTNDTAIPEQRFFMPATIVVYDKETQHLYLIKWIKSENITLQSYQKLCGDLAYILDRAYQAQERKRNKVMDKKSLQDVQDSFSVNISPEEFYDQVRYVKEQIRQGEIFQAVLSRRWQRKSSALPWKVYLQMREMNPSPYMFYLNWEDSVIMGASPEMQLKVKEGRVLTRPIAGTRKLTEDINKNIRLTKELETDPKEQAEHLMLLDLGRNDIGRISEPGTVKVTEFMQVEPYSHVIHLVSTVEGILKKNLKAMDAFFACFPAGTLSGAPKIRAMEIIEEVEKEPRGPYGGAVGHVGFDGSLDSCITIRSIFYKNGNYYLQAGAGIVADSVPELECKETVNKARFLMLAILGAEE